MTKAYHEAMAGLLDNTSMMRLPVSEKGIKLQEAQLEISKKAGINATPTFIISGRIIEGFEQIKIEDLLGK
jgi:thiol:disulfide interchange protein DsbC